MTEPEPMPAMGQKHVKTAAVATRDRPKVVTRTAAAALGRVSAHRLGVEGGTGENFENAGDRFAESMMKPQAKHDGTGKEEPKTPMYVRGMTRIPKDEFSLVEDDWHRTERSERNGADVL